MVRHEVAHVADRPQCDRISERIDEHRDRLRGARYPSLRTAAGRWWLWPTAHPAAAAREVNWDLVEKAEQRGAEFRADRRAVEVPGDVEALRTGLEKTDALESSWLERLLPHATTRGWRSNVTVRTPERERTHPLTHIRAAVAARRVTNRTLE